MTAIGRKDRQSLQELDVHIKECRKQFDDQIKCLDSRLESKLALVTDVKEFMLKRSEIELEYSRNLERLSDRFKDRFQKQRNNYGLSKKERAAPVNLWSKLLKDTKHKARAAATMGDILCKNVATRFSDMHDEINRTSSKVKEIHTVLTDVIIKVIINLQQSMKDYYTRHSEFTTAKTKLNESETAKNKAEKEAANKKGLEKRMKQLDRSKEKRRLRYNDSLIKTTRARNEYILLVEGTTAVLNKYFDHDVIDLVSKSDHNYHNSFKCALQAYCKSELFFANSVTSAADTLSLAIGIVDPDNDRLNFLEDNQILCNPERKFVVVKHSEDPITTITSVGAVHKELEKKQEDLYGKLQLMKKELAEIADVMNTRRNSLNDIYQQYDSEMNSQHSIDLLHPPPFLSSMPTVTPVNPNIKSAKEEVEHEYIYKFKELILNQKDDILRQAQYNILTSALGEISQEQKNRQQHSRDDFGSPRIIGSNTGQPIKLFGTTLDYQFKQTNLEIQDLVKSCIRFISRFGLEHQGIFRVSGTSQEIADLKKSFEEGTDPLAGLNHWKDINAVAGVLRAYFRELEEPLFPSKFCDDYIKISRLQSTEEQIHETTMIIDQFPPLNLHIIKYLFNFLNQVSLRSEKNKMPPHNLSVVFGPTVVHAPATAELITNQGQINIFIEFLISEFFSIFPNERPLNNDGTVQSDDENDIDDDGDVSDVTDDGDYL